MPTDFELLEAWRGGDKGAGNDLFERHFDPLKRFFRNKVGPEPMLDLIQKTFMVCVEKRDAFRGDSSFRTYLFAVAHNVLRNHFRAQARQRERYDFSSVSVHDLGPGPSTVIAQKQEHQVLLRALRRIPLDLQVLMELFYWENLEVKELAAILELPVGTVKSRMRRARQLLEQAIAELAESSEQLTETVTKLEDWARALRDQVQGAEDR